MKMILSFALLVAAPLFSMNDDRKDATLPIKKK
jgi:hypothetical protein